MTRIIDPCACCGAREVDDGCEGTCAQCWETAGYINRLWTREAIERLEAQIPVLDRIIKESRETAARLRALAGEK